LTWINVFAAQRDLFAPVLDRVPAMDCNQATNNGLPSAGEG
jgi:hypothetical protein